MLPFPEGATFAAHGVPEAPERLGASVSRWQAESESRNPSGGGFTLAGDGDRDGDPGLRTVRASIRVGVRTETG